LSKIEVEADSFIVIVTRGHLHDRTVLAQALKTRAGYIGMIGSRRKCGLIFDELRQEGFSEKDIHRVHAPIGLPIQAETPEEIGVSIVAEMIQVRRTLNEYGILAFSGTGPVRNLPSAPPAGRRCRGGQEKQ